MELNTFFSISEQMSQFLCAVPLGAIIGVFYDVFVIIRLLLPFMRNKVAVFLEDIIFMLVSAFLLFLYSYKFELSSVRYYVLAGTAIGFALYYLTLGQLIRFMLKGIISFVLRIFRKIFRRKSASASDETAS